MAVTSFATRLANSARVRAAREAWLMQRIFGPSAGASLQPPSPQPSPAEVRAILRGRRGSASVALVESAAAAPVTTTGDSLTVRELVDHLRGLVAGNLQAPQMREALADLLRRFEEGDGADMLESFGSAGRTLPHSPTVLPSTRFAVRAMLRGR